MRRQDSDERRACHGVYVAGRRLRSWSEGLVDLMTGTGTDGQAPRCKWQVRVSPVGMAGGEPFSGRGKWSSDSAADAPGGLWLALQLPHLQMDPEMTRAGGLVAGEEDAAP